MICPTLPSANDRIDRYGQIERQTVKSIAPDSGRGEHDR
jgi:hypothetical protein